MASPFGLRTDPITGEENCWHGGVDLVSPDPAAVVRASCGGYVLRSRIAPNDGSGDRTWEWGNYVSVLGDDGCVIYYCHLSKRLVSDGERVEAGRGLGIQGSTGRSTGNHLHFEVRQNGVQTDPCAYLGIPNETGFAWAPGTGEDAEPVSQDQAQIPEPPALRSWEDEVSPWAKDAVGRMIARGILLGRGNGDYALRENVTREEVCVMIERAMK